MGDVMKWTPGHEHWQTWLKTSGSKSEWEILEEARALADEYGKEMHDRALVAEKRLAECEALLARTGEK